MADERKGAGVDAELTWEDLEACGDPSWEQLAEVGDPTWDEIDDLEDDDE